MNSQSKIVVVVKPFSRYGGKSWIEVRLPWKTWVPSFHDLFRILQAICYCEDEKYPPPAEGRGFVMRFILDACKQGMTWEELQAKYKIPERDE